MIWKFGSEKITCSTRRFSQLVDRRIRSELIDGVETLDLVVLERSDVALRLFLYWNLAPGRTWLAMPRAVTAEPLVHFS